MGSELAKEWLFAVYGDKYSVEGKNILYLLIGLEPVQ
jgi:hypothetical protein